MIWILVIMAPHGAIPVMAFPTEQACQQAVIRISYELIPAHGSTMVCVNRERV